MDNITAQLYDLVNRLPRFGFPVPSADVPSSGIYLFFEQDESLGLDENVFDRITRIGTHRANGRLPGRLRQHYGSTRSMGGNKNASAFRRHVGGAIIRRVDESDSRLEAWVAHGGARPIEIEEMVSQHLRDRFWFSCIPVDDVTERRELERGLIALLAQHPIAGPSTGWLGHASHSQVVRDTGLWNVAETTRCPLSRSQLRRLEQLVASASG